MAIDKTALFESTKALWPQTIFTFDARNTLNRIYQANEDSYSVDDDWRQIAMWSFHQALWGLEREASAKGASRFSPSEISFNIFDKWMRSNLTGDDCWLPERAEWENDAPNT
ncbi:hypothetical protein ASD79_22465 [Caulobacter sp. Root655]|uniref:hypothetical protein n=1 Tax=Caulobacter sp. Root655 TaxID=1736578 RepID=UPI0006F76E7F|nr:hypothetical protein [Caulobacter sp. Root655]KRA62228.1 hypothetical protein ASD79_22465 [Caulobacter sp. Root655]